jgi:NADPH:quinone reductase-like Zn-dependent oxidoreductase
LHAIPQDMCCADVWWVWQENLRDLNALFEDKKLRPHIDRVVPLEKVGTHYTVIIHHRQWAMGNDRDPLVVSCAVSGEGGA